MSSRVQKGGTIFKPVVKSRSRTVAPSASRHASVALDSFAEPSAIRNASFSTRRPDQAPTVVTSSHAAPTTDITTLSESQPKVSAANTIPTIISSRIPAPVLIQVDPHPSTNVQSALFVDALAELPLTNTQSMELTDMNQNTAEFPSTDFPEPSTSTLFLPMTPPSPLATIPEQMTSMIHDDGTSNPPRNRDDRNERDPKRRRSSKRGEARTSELRRSPSQSRPSKTPRSRKRTPSLPPFTSDADPGEDIDPTAVTMAALCVDIGQGRISSKAAEIVDNHSAWKLKNREKRTRMRAIMEAKKYGRPDDEAEDSPENPKQAEEPQPSTSIGLIASSSTPPTTSGGIGNGFDYSQDLTTSRYNVQVRIGPNGETIIDEDSLVVDRAENHGTENFTHVIESDYTKFVNSATYGKRFRGSRWSAEETELFYDALSQYGENYELIAYVLPGRDRKACKNKFKMEDKKNSARITYSLNNRIPVDISTLSRMTGLDFSGPVPEIQAPQQPQSVVTTGDGHVENVDDANEGSSRQTKKRRRSQSHGISDGEVIVIGEADDLGTSYLE